MEEKYGVQIFSKNEAMVRLVLPNNKIKSDPIDTASLAGKPKPTLKDGLKPEKGDYLNTIFRAISRTYIKGYAIDLRAEGVLEAAVPMFEGLKLFRNHIMLTENIIGHVPKGWWDASDQFDAPGINVNPRLDIVLGWQEARQLLSDPPLLDSVSIGFNFKYKRSHEEMNWWMFYEMLGREVDGEIVRFIVTEITNVRELSLVWSGADELAKGGIIEITEELKEMLKAEGVDLDAAAAEAVEGEQIEDNEAQNLAAPKNQELNKPETNQGGQIMSTDLVIKNPVLLAIKFGKQEIKDEVQLQELIDGLVKENATLAADAKNGQEYLADLKQKAIAKAALVYGNGEEGYKTSTEMQSLIGKASLAELKEMIKNYDAVLAKNLPGLRSSTEELEEDDKVATTVKSDDPKAEKALEAFNKKVAELEKQGHSHRDAVALASQ
jgi:hypothetical protein